MKLDFKIRETDKITATNFVQKYHYSPVMPRLTKHFLGYYLNNKLVGILTLGWGTRPKHTIQKLFPSLDTKDYFEIGKMCLEPNLNNSKGAGSQMISKTIKWMKENTSCYFLYTLADGIMGKVGYVYQGSNFYFGEKYFTETYLMPNGEKLHPRSCKVLLEENAKLLKRDKMHRMSKCFMKKKGIKHIEGYMFRYIYPLNKTAKNMMKDKSVNPFEWDCESTILWTNGSEYSGDIQIYEHPKDDDLEWFDITDGRRNKKRISKPDFTFTSAKYNLKNINSHKKVA